LEIGTAWESTPGLIARKISKSLFERTVISVIDGELWDLERPLEKSCKLEFLDFEHPKGAHDRGIFDNNLVLTASLYRQTSLLALECSHPRRSCREEIRMSFV
jgi:hypothetical protein